MALDKRRIDREVAQLITRGMRQQGIPSWRKLEQLCDVSYGYLQHLAEGGIRSPKEETLRRLAHILGQRVEEYRAALLADRHELPAPVYYFSAHLGEPVDDQDAEIAMELLQKLVHRRSQAEGNGSDEGEQL
jgi:transcriptional regulator with XRE-family HTH domain